MPQDNFEMIPLLSSHTDDLVTMADGTGFFKEHEVQALREVLDDYHEENHIYEHKACFSTCLSIRPPNPFPCKSFCTTIHHNCQVPSVMGAGA